MLGRTHLACGLFLTTLFSHPLAWIVVLVSSLLPDIDQSNSFLGRKVKIIGKVFEHRTFFHSLLFFLPFSLLVYLSFPSLVIPFVIGFASHLILDSMTKQGLRIFPFSLRIRGPVRVGGTLEHMLFFLFLFLFLIRL